MDPQVWLFDLDDTLHHASLHVFPRQYEAMHRFIEQRFGLSREQASQRRRELFLRHGLTGYGLHVEHGVPLDEFFDHVQDDPELERLLHWEPPDWQALQRLPGRKVLLTNAQPGYTARVLRHIGGAHLFEQVVTFAQMRFAGKPRPKPDRRMLRMLCAALGVHPSRAVLVEDTLGHLKAARAVGLRCVLMQGFAARERRIAGRPAFVHARIHRIRELLARPFPSGRAQRPAQRHP
jgi:putative hydrolase of the HAD superfamily